MKHIGHHCDSAKTITARSCPVVSGQGRDQHDLSKSHGTCTADGNDRDAANTSLLTAELYRWLEQHSVQADVLEAFMEQVATAVAFQRIVGAHPMHIESPLSSEARRDLALIVATDAARQRHP